jgi:hypothetical protein
MKTNYLIGLSLIFVLSLGFSSCKSKKAVTKVASNNEVGTILEGLPCEDAGRSDKNFFRATSMATSSDLQLAKEKALILAKQRLTTLINSTTKTVTERYVNEREIGDAGEFEQSFENMTREVAEETLNNIVVTCEKASVLENKRYRAFVAIEVAKDDILNGLSRQISNDSKLQLDFDRSKFEETYNQEMEDYAKKNSL